MDTKRYISILLLLSCFTGSLYYLFAPESITPLRMYAFLVALMSLEMMRVLAKSKKEQ